MDVAPRYSLLTVLTLFILLTWFTVLTWFTLHIVLFGQYDGPVVFWL